MNNIETEIKYKVNKLPHFLPVCLYFRQIYFDGSKRIELLKEIFPEVNLNIISTFRVRMIKQNDIKYVCTLKSKGINYSRKEFEKEISKDVFDNLIKDNVLSEVIKNRYIINKESFNFEFDEYLNLKENLITCEVEVDVIDDIVIKKIEDILGNYFNLEYLNVSDDIRYRNSNLIKYFG